YCYGDHRDIHSFPTRRSSDLSNGYHLILNGRRTSRLNELKKNIEEEYNSEVYLLPFDVQVKKDVFLAFESLPEKWKRIDVLVNRSEEHTSELQSRENLVCRLL